MIINLFIDAANIFSQRLCKPCIKKVRKHLKERESEPQEPVPAPLQESSSELSQDTSVSLYSQSREEQQDITVKVNETLIAFGESPLKCPSKVYQHFCR